MSGRTALGRYGTDARLAAATKRFSPSLAAEPVVKLLAPRKPAGKYPVGRHRLQLERSMPKRLTMPFMLWSCGPLMKKSGMVFFSGVAEEVAVPNVFSFSITSVSRPSRQRCRANGQTETPAPITMTSTRNSVMGLALMRAEGVAVLKATCPPCVHVTTPSLAATAVLAPASVRTERNSLSLLIKSCLTR